MNRAHDSNAELGGERREGRVGTCSPLMVIAMLMLLGSACVATTESTAPGRDQPECADVIDATVERDGDRFVVAATVLSTDTGWDRYADAWEIRALDGRVIDTRILAHPHVDEQPFTRSLSGVAIPADEGTVEIAAHDSVGGFCGTTLRVTVPHP